MRPVDLENSTDLSVVTDMTVKSGIVTPSTMVMELEKLINFYRYNMWNGAASITHLLVNGEYSQMDALLSGIRERLHVKADVLVKNLYNLRPGKRCQRDSTGQ